jgi:hypothetical protein
LTDAADLICLSPSLAEAFVKITRFVLTFAALSVFGCSDTSSPTLSPFAPAYSFVVVGCNRVDKADTAGNVSTANIVQLTRTFNDIAALNPRPKFLFFAGDLTLGYTSDTVQLAKELQAWRALYEASPLPGLGIELVAIPGNHETQNISKIAYAPGERTWLRVMAPYITRGGNGPGVGGADALQTDQSNLTYSFNYKDTHFITMNTDPVGKDWHVPVSWISNDVLAARANGAKHIFAIGHKPAYPYPTVPTDGLSQDTTSRNALWTALTGSHVEAMFAAHNHVYYRNQPVADKTWMIIAGNGGSPLEGTIDPSIPSTGNYYGFVVTTVTKGGRVYIRSYGRDIPAAGYTAAAPAATYPTTVRDSLEITSH